MSSYEAVPKLKKVRSKSGSEIRLEKDASYLGSYWREFASYSPYEVEVEGEFNKILLSARSGNRTVGAAFHGQSGVLLFLPPLRYDEDKFVGNDDNGAVEKSYWTSEALHFGKRLVVALVGLADILKQSTQKTPSPGWTLDSKYRLSVEGDLESAISACAAEIVGLQSRRTELESQLTNAGNLRRLLFEQGRQLEEAVREAMKLLGFDAESFSNGESEFDVVFVSSEGRCIGEVEGKDNKPVNIDKFSQLERNLHEDFARESVAECAKGVLFGNAFRLMPVAERAEFFTSKCLSAAKRVGAALVQTPDLFAPARYIKENPTDREYMRRCREAILSCQGAVVTFPALPFIEEISLVEGKPTA